MKKIFSILIILSFMLLYGGCQNNSKEKNNPPSNSTDQSVIEQSAKTDTKSLIVYFSWSGNTKNLAQTIQSQTNADIFEIEAVVPYGDDYDTVDGTGVRDYIHVLDLSHGHVKALEKLSENPGLVTYNLGTGKGYSVLELVNAFSKASGKEIPYKITERRPGDIAACYADPTKAEKELGWKPKHNFEDGLKETIQWYLNNEDWVKNIQSGEYQKWIEKNYKERQ